jgi:hypothetical protein
LAGFIQFALEQEGVPDEVKHYKGICEVGSLIGAVDDVDMQILADLDVVRFQVDVRSIKKFPMVKQFAVTPWMYNITFSIERILEEGTLDEVVTVTSEVQKSSDVQMVDEEEQARAAKKLKASTEESKIANKNAERGDSEKNKDEGMVVDKVSQTQDSDVKLALSCTAPPAISISHWQTHNLPLCSTCNFTNITII